METTYVMIKPDGVQRGLVGEIFGRFERKGLKLVGMKSMVPTEEIARTHYDVHKERPFFPGLIKFVTSGPVVCMAWQGKDAISVARKLIGATNGREADPGTIRGDFGMDMGYNMIHGSDAPETAAVRTWTLVPRRTHGMEQHHGHLGLRVKSPPIQRR